MVTSKTDGLFDMVSSSSERDGIERELDAVRRALVEKEVRQGVLVDERDRLKTEVPHQLLVLTLHSHLTLLFSSLQ